MDKRFLIIMGIIVVAFLGIFFLGNTKKDTQSTETVGTVSNHSIGNNAKNVELLVYGDFECPACGQFSVIEKQVVDTYQNDIKFTFRHFPIDTIHPNARAAARAAEAAGAQGKFFEMHDLLYQTQSQWSSQVTTNPQSIFEEYAKQLELDIDKFKVDYAAESTNSTINADKNEGNSKGVSGTPTYYVNGQKVDNSQLTTVEGFSKVIQDAINASSSTQ
jgi:protein-disulfide isomerase